MPLPFLLLAAWTDALRDPSMPGLALLEVERGEDWPADPDGEPHPDGCDCPDCDPESPILEDNA